MIKIRSIWMFIVLLLCAVPLQASDSTNVVPHTQNDHNDLDMYGQNIVNVGGVNTGNVTLTQVYTVGDPCEEGQLGRDDGGEILACKSGSWAKAQGGQAGAFGGIYCSEAGIPNAMTGQYSCPPEFLPFKIDIYRSLSGNDPDGNVMACYKPTDCKSTLSPGYVYIKKNYYCKFL